MSSRTEVAVASPSRALAIPWTSDPAVGRRALADAVPIAVGYLPYGMVLGATIAASPLPRGALWAATPLLFAGGAQLALIDLLESGAASVVVVMTALVINLRLVMYSGAVAPWFRTAGHGTRLAAAALVIDPLFSMAVTRFPDLPDDAARRRYWFALGIVLWTLWQVEVAVGMVVGGVLPDAVPLDLAVPLTFLAMLVPTLVDRPAVTAAVAGAGVALVARALPLHLGLVVGAAAGVAAGMWAAAHPEAAP